MSNYIKKQTNLFIKEHSLGEVNYSSLSRAAEELGYMVIEFNSYANNDDVETVIRNLRLEKNVLLSRGFTYTDSDHRLIFINAELNEKEKRIVISHELGHVVLDHSTGNAVIGKDVAEEHEANEFVHYLFYQSVLIKLSRFISGRKKRIIVLAAVMVAAIVASQIIYAVREQVYISNYYVSPSGNKYHKRDCMYIRNKETVRRITKDELESGAYEPCSVCLPEE